MDCGATSEFIDTQFAARLGLALQPSQREIKLADGSITRADGEVTVAWTLDAAKGMPLSFTSTFTATSLGQLDAILGMSWLETHDPIIGWKRRTIEIRTPGKVPRYIRPIEDLCPESDRPEQITMISLKGLKRAQRRGQIAEVYAVFVRPESAAKAVEEKDPAVRALLDKYRSVFPPALPNELPPERGVAHRIELKPGSRPPPVRPLHHQSSKDLAVFDEYIREGLANGTIRVSKSPYGAMALVVRKNDKTRVVVDYRALNELTIKNKYPLPLMDELFDRVHGAKCFSKLDLRTGFHQIRMAEEDIEKTAFRTRYGSYEYLVLPMGLCNAPGTFMQLMNDTFRDMLDRSVLVFLDDILIFSKTREEHLQHLEAVLARLRDNKLYAKLSKCEFMREEVEFLGHRLGVNGLAVSPDKVSAVRDWPTPKGVPDVRSFLGLAGFYRRFVQAFSMKALPLTELTKNDVPFVWGERQQKSFDELKAALCSAPVLLIPNPDLPFTLNVDACDYAVGGTLQQDHGRGLQPVAFRSRKLTPAERNYDVREKEFLAFVDACSVWRHYLHSEKPFLFLTDHDSLKYHKTMPNLSGRLARWIEKLAEFNYTVEHIAGVKNIVADAISRRADLKGNRFAVLAQDSGLTESESADVLTTATLVEAAAACIPMQNAGMSSTSVKSELTDMIRNAAVADPDYTARASSPSSSTTVRDELLFEDERLVVPNDKALRTKLLAECHDSTTGAHFGRDKTLSAMKARFRWSGMAKDVEHYVATCDECQRNKPSRQLTPGLLMPNAIPGRVCSEWTTDSVTGLPKTKRGKDAIQVYVERLGKLVHLTANRKTDGAAEHARLFARNVIRLHGVPEVVISDRDPRFTAKFFEECQRLVGTTLKMSTARHAQTDGQSEREIQTLIVALRAFCNEHQDDWDDYLDMLELGFNSAEQASTKQSPFEMIFGMLPRLPVDVALAAFEPKNPAAIDRAKRMFQAVEAGRGYLLNAQERQARNADRHRRPLTFKVGDAVLLSTEGLQLKRGTNKLCSRYIGPFPITAVVNRNAYTLQLPNQLEALHPTFNIEKLKVYRDGRGQFPDRPQRYSRPPPEIDADSNGDTVWVVDRILAKQRTRRGVRYLVAWEGYPPEESTWEPKAHLTSAAEAIAEFEAAQVPAAPLVGIEPNPGPHDSLQAITLALPRSRPTEPILTDDEAYITFLGLAVILSSQFPTPSTVEMVPNHQGPRSHGKPCDGF